MMNMQHAIVAIENAFYRIDLIGWIDYFNGLSRHGKMRKIAWYDVGGFQIENILRRYGVHAYGRALQAELEKDGDKFRKVYLRWMWVQEKQADWATDLLWKAGIACVAGDRRAEKRDRWSQTLPVEWGVTRRRTVIEMFGDSLAGARDNRRPSRKQRKERYQ